MPGLFIFASLTVLRILHLRESQSVYQQVRVPVHRPSARSPAVHLRAIVRPPRLHSIASVGAHDGH